MDEVDRPFGAHGSKPESEDVDPHTKVQGKVGEPVHGVSDAVSGLDAGAPCDEGDELLVARPGYFRQLITEVGDTVAPGHDPTSSQRRGVAAFDVDGTLSRRDTLIPFLVRVRGRSAVLRAVAAASPNRNRSAAKAAVLRTILAGAHRGELAEIAQRFAAELVDRGMRPGMRARIDRHREEGHRLVVVSSSLELYLRPFADLLGIEGVLATRLVEQDGRLTGELEGLNVRRAEKVARLREWIGDEAVELWAYGNSGNDAPMLALADHPTWVGWSARLRRGAEPFP